MFTSSYFAPVILKAKDGRELLEILPYLFLDEPEGRELELEDIFFHPNPAELLDSSALNETPQRTEIELDEGFFAMAIMLLADCVGFTARSTHFHHENMGGPYFAPALVAHAVHFGRIDTRGIPYVDRVRQAFLNAEVANSTTDMSEEMNELILASTWLSAIPHIRPWEFYRKISADDLTYWNISEEVCNVIEKLDQSRFETVRAQKLALNADVAAKTVRLAYLCELSSRPIKIELFDPFSRADESLDRFIPDRPFLRDRYVFSVQAEVRELGVSKETDEWFVDCVNTPPTSMRGPYASDESEAIIGRALESFRPRWTIPPEDDVFDIAKAAVDIVSIGKLPETIDVDVLVVAQTIAHVLYNARDVLPLPPVVEVSLLDITRRQIESTTGLYFDARNLPNGYVQEKAEAAFALVQLASAHRHHTEMFDWIGIVRNLSDDEYSFLGTITQLFGNFTFEDRLFGNDRAALHEFTQGNFWGIYKTVIGEFEARVDPFSGIQDGIEPDSDLLEHFISDNFFDSHFDKSRRGFDRLDALWLQHRGNLDFWNKISERSGGEKVIQVRDVFVGLGSFLWRLAIDSRSPVSASLRADVFGLEIRLTQVHGAIEVEVFAWSDIPSPLVEFAQGIASKGWKFTPFDYRGLPISTQLFKRVSTDNQFDGGEWSLTSFLEEWTAIVGVGGFKLRSSSENPATDLKVRLWSTDDWAQTRLSVRQSWMEYFMRDLP
jgi:hypothetical protein